MAAYRLDVLDPAVTPRRIVVLTDRLPPWAISPGDTWGAEAELLALLVDHVAQLTWVTLKAAGSKSVSKPRPIPRPARRVRSPGAASSGPRSGAPGPAVPGKTGSWAEAAAQLAAIPGVIVQAEGGGADG